METIAISVTEASRNFSDCVSRAHYQGTTFILLKTGVPVAHIIPAAPAPKKGNELAAELEQAVDGAHLDEKEATSWLHDLEQSRRSIQPQGRPWRI